MAGERMGESRMKPLHLVRALGGAIAGAIAGYMAFAWLMRQGLYALAIPGATLGLGCRLSTGQRSLTTGIACGILAILLGLYIEWRFFPFLDDYSLGYFVSHLHELKPVTLLMITAGGLFGGYFGWGSHPKN
jgi:hypothetical protein